MIQFKIVYVLQNEPNLSSDLQMLVFGARLCPSGVVASPRRPQIGPVFIPFNVLGVRCALDEHHAQNWVRFGKKANQAQARMPALGVRLLNLKYLRWSATPENLNALFRDCPSAKTTGLDIMKKKGKDVGFLVVNDLI
jgi:hypothetical protein